MTEIDETLKEFLVESSENLDQLDRELIALEEDPSGDETINTIFRIVHTIKGTCGFFSYSTLERVSHCGENLLDSLRSRRIPVTPSVVSGLLSLGDALRTLLVRIEQTGTEGTDDYAELAGLLNALNDPSEHEETGAAERSETFDEFELAFLAAQEEFRGSIEEGPAEAMVEASVVTPPSTSTPVELTAPRAAVPAGPGEETRKSELTESALRVDVTLLDKLMNLVGELVLARNQILQFTKSQSDADFINTSQRLNLITSELQEGVMRTRMQPIANAWNKLPRIVRDIAHTCGKRVRLEMHGKETELDKTIIEAIKDPLTHIIRNAVDHGIEEPSAREAAGKRAEGVLFMKAYHEGGQVIIEISDDGAGLNPERIRRKALERGIITPDKASRMLEQDMQRLIFLPGFSTAEKVTNISGRGVGMDVVRSNIERIGGTVDVASKFGHGSTFTIKIPLTLAIIPGLIVTANGNRYAIPQVNLLELVRIEGDQIKTNLEEIHGAVFYRLRGKLLPVVNLREELDESERGTLDDFSVMNIVVVRADNHQFGLVVDAIYDTEEIVVKPLGRLLKVIPAFAGATIMGDGQVALILDVVGLARKARITKEDSAAQEAELASEVEAAVDRKKLLIFRVDERRRAAIPLDQVHRLEEFPVEKLERAGDSVVVQYRGAILTLVDLNATLSGREPRYEEVVRAFVHRIGGTYVGFVVNEILDIVEEAVNLERPYRKPGLSGSAVIQGLVTDVIDLPSVLDCAALDLTGTDEAQWTNK